jgi:hypothetical protein
MDHTNELQSYEISREDFEKLGRGTGEEEFMRHGRLHAPLASRA